MKTFKEIHEESQDLEPLKEMAAVGEIRSPKVGHFYIEVFSREYKTETPHATLLKPQSGGKIPLIKIAIPTQQPNQNDEPKFIWIRDGFTVSNSLKKEIQNWFVTKDEDGLTGWQLANTFWKKQAQAVSWGQLQK